MKPSPGVWGGTGLDGGCDLAGFPGLGSPTLCEERAEEATLRSWSTRAPRDICSAPSPHWIEEETKSQRGVESVGSLCVGCEVSSESMPRST